MSQRMKVAGQAEAISLYSLDVDYDGAFVTLRVESTMESGYATMTPDQADAVAEMLKAKAEVARKNSGFTYSGESP